MNVIVEILLPPPLLAKLMLPPPILEAAHVALEEPNEVRELHLGAYSGPRLGHDGRFLAVGHPDPRLDQVAAAVIGHADSGRDAAVAVHEERPPGARIHDEIESTQSREA